MPSNVFRFFGLRFLRSLFTSDLAIDLGTSNTLIYIPGKGIIANEPSVLVIRKDFEPDDLQSVVAVGKKAKEVMGLTPENLFCIRPLKDGVISDYKITQVMIKSMIGMAQRDGAMGMLNRIVICVPVGATQVERRIIRDAALAGGAWEVYLVDEISAAGIGAGLPVTEGTGSMVVDIGGGSTDVGVLSLCGKAQAYTLRVGGDRFDELIVQHMRRQYSLLIDDTTAEDAKKEIGSAYAGSKVGNLEVHGRCMNQGLPRSQVVSAEEILELFAEPLHQIRSMVRKCLENTPPKLITTVKQRGITLTGGGALLHGLDRMLSEETQIKVMIADDPLTCVARGCGIMLEHMEQFPGMYQTE